MKHQAYEVTVIVQVRPVSPRAALATAMARGMAIDPVNVEKWGDRVVKALERAIRDAEENVLEQIAADAQQLKLLEVEP